MRQKAYYVGEAGANTTSMEKPVEQSQRIIVQVVQEKGNISVVKTKCDKLDVQNRPVVNR